VKRYKSLAGAIAIVLFMTGLAIASTHGGGGGEAAAGGHGGGHEYDAAMWRNLIYRIITFLIFVGVLWYFLRNKVKEAFSGRRYRIETELKDLETRKQEAQTRLSEVEKSIANLSQERDNILEEARKQGEAMKQSIIADAQKMADQITTQAERTAQQETKAALDGIRAEVADMVVDAARKLLAEKLGEEDHDKLINEYLAKVVLN